VPGGDPEPDRRAVVEHVQREAAEAEYFRQAIDDALSSRAQATEVTGLPDGLSGLACGPAFAE